MPGPRDHDFTVGPRVTTGDGVDIATYDLGGDGPPVLFAHATGFHGRVWLPVARALRPHYRCLAFDARGHGESAKAGRAGCDWRGFAADVRAVVTGLGLDRPRAVGHSSGGTALLLAQQAQPTTFAALYCYEPIVPVGPEPVAAAGHPGAPDAKALAAGARRRREVFASTEAALANYRVKPPFTSFDPASLDAYVTYGFDLLADGTVRLRCRGEDEAGIYEMAFRHRAFERLDLVDCPVTLAGGGTGAHVGVDQLAAMASRLGTAAIEVHADLGHFGPMEAPAEVADAVAAAFARPCRPVDSESLDPEPLDWETP